MGNIHLLIATTAGRILLAGTLALFGGTLLAWWASVKDSLSTSSVVILFSVLVMALGTGVWLLAAFWDHYLLKGERKRILECLTELREAGVVAKRVSYFAGVWSGDSDMLKLKTNICFTALKNRVGDGRIPHVGYEDYNDVVTGAPGKVALITIDAFEEFLKGRGVL